MKFVKCTVGALIAKGNKILLTKRNIEPFKGYWCLPGGHIDFGEDVITAVKREVKEETNLDFKPKFFSFYNEIIKEIGWHAVVLVFTGKAVGKLKKDMCEVKEIKWFSFDEIKNLSIAFDNRRITKEYFDKAFK